MKLSNQNTNDRTELERSLASTCLVIQWHRGMILRVTSSGSKGFSNMAEG